MNFTITSYTDEELIADIKSSDNALSDRAFIRVYKNCKPKSLSFLRINGVDNDTAEDIFQDAVIVLYEKIRNGAYTQQSSLQTYLNSICRFQFLKQMRDNKEFKVPEGFEFDDKISDWLQPETDEKEEKIGVIESALIKMKESGGNCYGILFAFYYEHKSMQELAISYNYTNADNAKTQKAKCQKRLKEMVNGK